MSDDQVRVAWIIKGPKITDYLLNPEHEDGGPKARYLLRFGFTARNHKALADALVAHALSNLPGTVKSFPKGPNRVVFEGTVTAPDGRAMPLRTVWEVAPEGYEMRFLTAVPLTK